MKSWHKWFAQKQYPRFQSDSTIQSQHNQYTQIQYPKFTTRVAPTKTLIRENHSRIYFNIAWSAIPASTPSPKHIRPISPSQSPQKRSGTNYDFQGLSSTPAHPKASSTQSKVWRVRMTYYTISQRRVHRLSSYSEHPIHAATEEGDITMLIGLNVMKNQGLAIDFRN